MCLKMKTLIRTKICEFRGSLGFNDMKESICAYSHKLVDHSGQYECSNVLK